MPREEHRLHCVQRPGDIGFPKVKARWRTRTCGSGDSPRRTSHSVSGAETARQRLAHAGINLMPSNAGICTVESARRAPSVLHYRGRRRVPVTVRRQPRGAPRVLSTAGGGRAADSGRAETTPADRFPAGNRQSVGPQLPGGHEPGLARILGVMLKLDFQRAVLQRIRRSRRSQSGSGGISSSSATSITPLRPSAKRIRPGTSARLRCRDRRS